MTQYNKLYVLRNTYADISVTSTAFFIRERFRSKKEQVWDSEKARLEYITVRNGLLAGSYCWHLFQVSF